MEIVVFSRVLTLALSRYGFRSMVAIGPASTRIRRATSLKVRMHASLLCRDSTSRIVNEHGVQKVEPIVIQAVNKRSGWIARPLGERWFEVRERCYTRPIVIIGCTQESGRH